MFDECSDLLQVYVERRGEKFSRFDVGVILQAKERLAQLDYLVEQAGGSRRSRYRKRR